VKRKTKRKAGKREEKKRRVFVSFVFGKKVGKS
jgi:hypothetical protein